MVERLRLDAVDKAAKGNNGRAGLMMTGLVAPPPRLKAMTPMGVSGVSVLSGYVRTTEKNADWVGSRKWQTIADMSVNVSIVAASVGFFLNMVAHPAWTVKPAEDVKEGKSSKEAEKLAEFVHEVINDMTTPWQRVVRRSAMYRFNGFGIQEWIAKKRDDGKIGIKDIEPRPPFTIERWAVDDDGTILGVWQRSPQTFELLGLPRGKLIYLVDDTYTDQPDGIGVYRMLAEPFNRLKQYLELEARAYERDMRGIPIGRAPITAIRQMVKEGRLTDKEGEGLLQGIRDFITTQVRDKNTSLLMDSLPYENQTADGLTIAGTQQWDVSLLSGGVSGFADMAKAIDRLQREIARIIGTEHLMMGDQGGNRALSEDKSRNLYLIANAVLANIADAMNHDVIDPVWSLNGFDPKLKPKFSTEDVAFKNAQEIATALQAMAAAGAVLQPNDPAIDDVRDLLGIAKAPEMTPAQIGMMQGAAAGAPGAPGAAGGPFGAKKPPQPAPTPAAGANGKAPGRGSPPQLDDAKQQQVADTTDSQSKRPGQKPVPTKKRWDEYDEFRKYNHYHGEHGYFASGSGDPTSTAGWGGSGPGGSLSIDDYANQAMGNLGRTSRTAQGVLDTSSSAGKEDKLVAGLTGEHAAMQAKQNFEGAIRDLYYERNDVPDRWRDMEVRVDKLAEDINQGIVRPGEVNRTLETKFPNQTSALDLPIAKKQFAQELTDRLRDPHADPVETAAWIEWRANIMDHFWSDGVGKTSKALAALPLMRAGIALPNYPDNKVFYGYAPKTKVDPRNGGSAYLGSEWKKFNDYYHTLIPVRKYNPNHVPAGSPEGGQFAPKDGQLELPFESRALVPAESHALVPMESGPNANSLATQLPAAANDNLPVSRKDPEASLKTRQWLALNARRKLADGLSSVKEVGAELGASTAREFAVIAAVDMVMHAVVPVLPEPFGALTAAALTATVGKIATKLGVTEENIRHGLRAGINKLIEFRKSQLTLGRLRAVPAGAVVDLDRGRILTKGDEDIGLFFLFKDDNAAGPDDAILQWLYAINDMLDHPTPAQRDPATQPAANATVHVNRLHDVTDMTVKYNHEHDPKSGEFAPTGEGEVSGGGGAELTGTAQWVRPSEANMRQEYKVEYQHHFKDAHGDMFPNEQDFVDAVKAAPTVTVDRALDGRISNRSQTSSMSSLLGLIRGYRSYPKFRNEKTLTALEDRIKTGKPTDMAIVTKDGNSMRVLSGNTRMDIGFMHNDRVKVVMLDVGKYRKYNEKHQPGGSPQGGEFAPKDGGEGGGVGGGKNYGLVPGDVQKFHELKSQWAKVNNNLLTHIDHPDSPEAQIAMHEMERISKEIGQLHADPGGPEGIGLPGGPRDVTIIGAGPGGLAASIFGGAEGLDTLIVEKNVEAGGQARYSSRIENFPGFPVGVTGETLTSNMFEQSARLGAENKLGVSVTGMTVDPITGMKTLTMSDGTSVDSRTVILAGGVEFRQPDFPGADGSGVFVGDGKKLAEESVGGTAVVLGGSNGAAQAALGAATQADQVYLISRSPIAKGMSDYQVSALGNQPKVTVLENDGIASLNRDAAGNPVSITTKSGQTISTKAVGVFTGSVPSTNWLPSGISRNKAGMVTTDRNLQTSIPGVFAVGDMREGAIGRIGVAVGEGQLALREAHVYLEDSRKAQAKLDVAIAHDDTHKAAQTFNASDLLTRLFAIDRANPWFGQTVEDVKPPVKKYNEKHQPGGSPEGGQFAPKDGGGEGGGSAEGGHKVNSAGELVGYVPKPVSSASELYERTRDPSATPESVMAIAGPDVAAKAAEAERRLKDDVATQTKFLGKDGKYIPTREALHNDILHNGGIDSKGKRTAWTGFTPEAIANARPAEGEQKTLYVLGGRGGAGKSWFSKSPDSPFDASKTMYINSDDFKESLPEYAGWNAGSVHEEASDIANRAHEWARNAGLNVTFDATLKSSGSVSKLISDYEKAGYKIEGYFMHTAPQVSAVRAMHRFNHTGRYVPAKYILGSTSNEATFDSMRTRFSKWAVYDNNTGRGPVKVAENKR